MKLNVCLFLLLLILLPPCPCDAAELSPIRLSDDGASFVLAESKTKFVPWGVNYDHDRDGKLIEDYWLSDWQTVVDDFAEIKSLDANVVRVHLQLPRFMESATKANKTNLRQLSRLLRLAESTGLYLDITGLGCYHKQDVPQWYDALEESQRWKVQANFWREVASVCRDSPAVFCYDLMNEPIVAGKEKETQWLTGELGGKHFVQRICLDLAGRSRKQIAKQWIDQMTSAIREVDQGHLITVGAIPWAMVFEGAKPLFHDPEVGAALDFVSVHFYPKSGEMDAAIEALKVYDIGKPLVIEEMFPLKCSVEEMAQFIERSRPVCDGWISFYWGTTIQENQAKGDLVGAIMSQWLAKFQELSKDIENCQTSQAGSLRHLKK